MKQVESTLCTAFFILATYSVIVIETLNRLSYAVWILERIIETNKSSQLFIMFIMYDISYIEDFLYNSVPHMSPKTYFPFSYH